MTTRLVVVTIAVCLGLSPAHAQPVPDAAPQPPTSPAADPPGIVDKYDRAFTDFTERRYADAASEFDEVAATTLDPARRKLAVEMAGRARAMLTPAPAATTTTTATPSDGRTSLLIGTTVMGLGLYGWALPYAAGVTDSKTFIGLYMLGAGASFFGPYLVTKDTHVTLGMSDAWWWGSTRGAYHGAMLQFALNGDHPTGKDTAATMSVTSIAEGLGALLWAQHTNASAALTNLMSKGGDFGSQFAVGIALVAAPRSDTSQTKFKIAGGAGLLGAAAGVVGGYELAQHRDYTWGDSEVWRTAGYLGAYISAVPLVIGESSDYRVDFAVLMGGAAVGLVVGDRLLEDHDFSAGQGILNELGALAGAGLGAGVGYLVSPSNDGKTEGKIIITSSVAGAIGGFALTYLGLDTVHHSNRNAAVPSLQIAPQIGPDQKGVMLLGSF